MRMHVTLIFLLLLALTTSASQAQGWKWQNPLPHGQTINDITMLDAQTGVAACNNGYYLFTANAGITWSTRRIGRTNIERMLLAGDGSVIAISDRRRIYRSTDRAYSWEVVYQGFDNSSGQWSDVVAADENTFVGFLNGSHVVVSEDQGRSWRQIDNINFLSESVRSISAQSATTWYVVTSRNVVKTEDRGEHWSNANSEFQVQGLQRFIFVDSLYGYQLREGQLLRTHDGGATWTEMDIFGFDTVTDVAVGPQLGDNVFCMSVGRYLINKSSDAGESWNISLTESAFSGANPTSIAFIDEHIGFIGGEGGRMLRTVDGGQSWSIIHGIGYVGTVSQLLFRNDSVGAAATYSPTLMVTSNGGDRWNEVIPSDDHTILHGAYSPEGSMFLVGTNATRDYDLLRSDDDGLTWTVVGRLPLEYSSSRPEITQSLHARSDLDIWIGATYSLLLHSTDGGITWNRSVAGSAIQNPYSTGSDIFFFPPATIMYVRSNSMEVSSDGGQTWESRSTGNGRSIRSVQFIDELTGFALLPSEFARTTDGGLSWQVTWDFTPWMLHFFDAQNGVALWSNPQEDDLAYLMRTQDGGENWERFSMNERVSWNEWFWLSPDVGWSYGSGGLIRRTDNGGIADAGAFPALPGILQLQPGYPNPYSLREHGAVTVPFTLAQQSPVRLILYDMLGRPAATIDRGRLAPGDHSIVLDRTTFVTLRAGMYLYRLEAGAQAQTGKIVIQ